MEILLEIPTCEVLVFTSFSVEQFVFVWFIPSPCRRVFEIVRIHQQREFSKSGMSLGSIETKSAKLKCATVFPFLNLLSRCSQTQSKLEVLELRSKDIIFLCLEGILRFILNYSSKQQNQYCSWPAIATASMACVFTWNYYTIG